MSHDIIPPCHMLDHIHIWYDIIHDIIYDIIYDIIHHDMSKLISKMLLACNLSRSKNTTPIIASLEIGAKSICLALNQ